MNAIDWSIVLDVGVGIGVLLVGVGVLIGMLALAKTCARLNQSLQEIDRIAGSADKSLTRINGAAASLESAAGSVAKTATLAQEAVTPAIVNVGATVTGISAGLRRFVSGRREDKP